MTTLELIVKGSIIGVFLFAGMRYFYYRGFRNGAERMRDFILNEIKKKQ